MRAGELLRLVGLNINQNKFKSVMTSVGIVVGAATIVMVIAIGKGGQMDVAEQFASLNAGAIDITYEYEEEESGGTFGGGAGMMPGFLSGMFGMGNFGGGGNMPSSGGGGGRPSFGGGGGRPSFGGGGEMPSFGGGNMPSFDGGSTPFGDGENPFGDELPERMEIPEGDEAAAGEESLMENPEGAEADEEQEVDENEDSVVNERINRERIVLTEDDVRDIETFVTGITGAMITYTTKASVEGGNLTDAQSYTIAGVKENYASLSNISLAAGYFFDVQEEQSHNRVCVLGATAAKELFGSADSALDSQIYIDDRTYTVEGILSPTGAVSGGISSDSTILIPYETGIKYITGNDISPTLTVIAENVDVLNQVITDVKMVLKENYSNAEFTFSDAGSKMEAAQSSNEILTLLLSAMAMIVFIVGGIGIMNVLFVSVKERTNEIGILKALGASRSVILIEFLIESAVISLMGGMIGAALSFMITPIVEYNGIRVETTIEAMLAAVGFAVLTGTVFGLYPAWKASRLEPVEALNAE